MKALLDRFSAIQDLPISTASGSLDPYRYFERLRVILEFFGTATGQNNAQSSFTLVSHSVTDPALVLERVRRKQPQRDWQVCEKGERNRADGAGRGQGGLLDIPGERGARRHGIRG